MQQLVNNHPTMGVAHLALGILYKKNDMFPKVSKKTSVRSNRKETVVNTIKFSQTILLSAALMTATASSRICLSNL